MLNPSMQVSVKDCAAAEYVVRSHRKIVRDALMSSNFAMSDILYRSADEQFSK
jgi:hypothetical protein